MLFHAHSVYTHLTNVLLADVIWQTAFRSSFGAIKIIALIAFFEGFLLFFSVRCWHLALGNAFCIIIEVCEVWL
jgi:hypothetical protein